MLWLKQADSFDSYCQWPLFTSYQGHLYYMISNIKGHISTLTSTPMRTKSDPSDDMAFTETGISPRTSGLMGMRTDAPLWLLTDTWRTLGVGSSSLSGKTNWKVSLCATITMTWQQRQRGFTQRADNTSSAGRHKTAFCWNRILK